MSWCTASIVYACCSRYVEHLHLQELRFELFIVSALVAPEEKQINKKQLLYMRSIQFSFRSFLYNFNRQLKIQQTNRNVNTVPILLTKFAAEDA